MEVRSQEASIHLCHSISGRIGNGTVGHTRHPHRPGHPGRLLQYAGINSAGQIVGRSDTRSAISGLHLNAFLYTTGRLMTDLNIGGSALGINGAGQVVSARLLSKQGNATHAFLSSGGTMTDLGTLPGGGFRTTTGINASGQISGHSQLGSSSGTGYHAFLYSAGVVKDLDALTSYSYGINACGQVLDPPEIPLGIRPSRRNRVIPW